MKNKAESERFNAVRKKAGLTYREFGAALGLAESHVANIINGRRSPGREVLQKLKDKFDVDLNLFLSDGSKAEKMIETTYVELIRQEAAAGIGAAIEDNAERVIIPVPTEIIGPHADGQIQALIVRGDSMTGDHIFDGDIIFIDRSINQGDYIFVLSDGTDLLVKRVQIDRIKKSITLLSSNPAYPPRAFTGPDREKIKIEGKVIAWTHRV